MWLSARGDGSGDYIWQQTQQQGEEEGQQQQGQVLTGDNRLWFSGNPGSHELGSDYCLYLLVTEDNWNTAPEQPYAARECSQTTGTFALCEGKSPS